MEDTLRPGQSRFWLKAVSGFGAGVPSFKLVLILSHSTMSGYWLEPGVSGIGATGMVQTLDVRRMPMATAISIVFLVDRQYKVFDTRVRSASARCQERRACMRTGYLWED